MPLVLTQNEATESGHEYADVLGIAYEYPTRYRRLIRSGERFVYYRGRRTATGFVRPQVYLGRGVIGRIRDSSTPGRLVCSIEDYEPFTDPLPFKAGALYLESGARRLGSRAGLYFRQGVREVSDSDFRAILERVDALDQTEGPSRRRPTSLYPSPESARLVDDVAMEQAMGEATRLFPESAVERMPHNNPGFDIEVVAAGERRYIEVKGTTLPRPRFFMSEGERRFSEAHAGSYSLWVVYSIDMRARRGTLVKREGSVGEMSADLVPTQWMGVLPLDGRAS
jgi:hypothetical protein